MSNIEIIMAFDFGIKKIGVAIGQKITYTAKPLKVLKSHLGRPNWSDIKLIYDEWKPMKFIVGLPLKLDGSQQPITILSKQFAMQLQKRFQIAVEMFDERFSTTEARLNQINYKSYYSIKQKKTNQIDSLAAEIILKSWLNKQISYSH